MSNPNGRASRLVARIREFLTLRDTRAELASFGVESSAGLARTLAIAEQRRAAAEALHFQGHRVEALRLVKEALEVSTEAATAFADARAGVPEGATESAENAPDSPVVRALVARGISRDAAQRVAGSVDSTASLAVPVLDADLAVDSDDDFVAAREGVETIMSALVDVASTDAELRRRAITRVALVALVLVGIVALATFIARSPIRLTASASATLHPSFGAELAVDGRDDSRFLLPDGQAGTLDVRPAKPRRIEHVVLLNSVNEPYNDRSTKDYAIEVYSRGRLAKRIAGHFAYSLHPERVSHAVGVDHVDRIRVVFLTFYRAGAGLSEIAVD